MTDNEIIKELEACANVQTTKHTCDCCKLFNVAKGGMVCVEYALDLINRQKAEYQALKEQEEKAHQHCRNVCEPKYKAEIDRLQKCNETNISSIATLYEKLKSAEAEIEGLRFALDLCKGWEERAKAEAIKEFADKIDEIFLRYAFLHSHADMARQDYIKAVDGTEIEMQSVWDVFTLKKYGIADYDEMNRLQTNIELIEKGRLLAELEKDFRLLVKERVGDNDA